MKKILFIAVVAFAFMACGGGNNGAELPSKDKKAFNKVTVEALDLVGQSSASVDKYLSDAGFKKAPNVTLENAPKRVKGQFKALAEEAEVMYIYGIDPDDYNMTEEEGIALFNKTIKKNSIIVVYAMYEGDKLAMLESSVIVQWAKGNSRIYTDVSDELYKQIPEDAVQVIWKGVINGKNEYAKQDEFVAAIAAAEDGIAAQEQGIAINAITAAGYDGFVYIGVWHNPTEKERNEMESAGFLPYAVASFGVGDIAASM